MKRFNRFIDFIVSYTHSPTASRNVIKNCELDTFRKICDVRIYVIHNSFYETYAQLPVMLYPKKCFNFFSCGFASRALTHVRAWYTKTLNLEFPNFITIICKNWKNLGDLENLHTSYAHKMFLLILSDCPWLIIT